MLAVIKLASKAGFTVIECTTNSTVVYDTLHCTKSNLSWDIRATIAAILDKFANLYQISFYRIFCQFNTFVDAIAKLYLRDLLKRLFTKKWNCIL